MVTSHVGIGTYEKADIQYRGRSYPVSGETMPTAICVRRPRLPVGKHTLTRSKDIDAKRIAFCYIARVRGATITTRAGRHTCKQIDLREELDEITGSLRTCLHEVLVGIARVAGAAEAIQCINRDRRHHVPCRCILRFCVVTFTRRMSPPLEM